MESLQSPLSQYSTPRAGRVQGIGTIGDSPIRRLYRIPDPWRFRDSNIHQAAVLTESPPGLPYHCVETFSRDLGGVLDILLVFAGNRTSLPSHTTEHRVFAVYLPTNPLHQPTTGYLMI